MAKINPGFHVIKFKLDSFCSLIKLLVAFPALLVVAFNTFNKKNCLLFLNFYKVSSQVQRHSYTLNPDRLFSSMKKKKQTFQCLRMLLASKHFYFTPITWRPLRNLLNDWGATFSRMLWWDTVDPFHFSGALFTRWQLLFVTFLHCSKMVNTAEE